MKTASFKRVIRAGVVGFWRNLVVSLACVLVTTVAMLIIGSLFLGNVLLSSSIDLVKDRVDINIYFKTDAGESDIMAVKDSLVKLPEVKMVEYTSREDAITAFKEKHKNNSLIIESLDELKSNPLGAVLSVKAKDPSQYEGIAKFLESDSSVLSADGSSIIDKVNYLQNKTIIDRLSVFIESAKKLGLAVSVLFAIIAALVTFNTIRLAIYTAKDEISVMKLVGASNWYIRSPFIVSGVFSGFISAVMAMIILYPATLWVGSATRNFFGGLDLFGYYINHLLNLSVVLIVSGILLGAISSYLAVRKYLRH